MPSLGEIHKEIVGMPEKGGKQILKTYVEYPTIKINKKAFPYFAEKGLDETCLAVVKVKVLGHPEFGRDKENTLILQLLEMEPVKKKTGEPHKEMGY